MKKIILSLLIAFAFVIISPTQNVFANYKDVKPSNWYYDSVMSLSDKQLLFGDSKGYFNPSDNIIRQNVAIILGRWLIQENFYIPEDALTTKRFYDLSLSSKKELLETSALVAEEGIFNGAKGKLNGTSYITREQTALVLVKIMKTIYGIDLIADAKTNKFTSKITDISTLSNSSIQAIQALEFSKITTNKKFNPKKNITRAEFAVFLNKAMKYGDATRVEKTAALEKVSNASLSENDTAIELSEAMQQEETEQVLNSIEETEVGTENAVPTEAEIIEVVDAKDPASHSELVVEAEAAPNAIQSELVTDEQPAQIEEISYSKSDYTHFKVKKGTKLYSSRNIVRIIAETKSDFTFPILQLANEDVVYFEIGKERYYLPLTSVQLVNEVKEGAKSASTLGYIRLPKGAVLYTDEAMKTPLIQTSIESRYAVKRISGNYAVLNANGKELYVSMDKSIQYDNLPYKLLADHDVYQAKASSVKIGTITKNVVVQATLFKAKQMYFMNNNEKFITSREAVIEVDEPVVYQKQNRSFEILATLKSKQNLYTDKGQLIGRLNAGTKVQIVHTANGNGYISYAGIDVKIPLTNVYHTNFVDGSKVLYYETMEKQLKAIHTLYPHFTKLEIIGYTVEGKAIYALKVGNGKREILMDASLHAREHMTTNVIMEMIDNYTNAYARNTSYANYNVKSVLDKTSIWFIPMVNVDGVTLVQKGLNAAKNKQSIIKLNEGSSNVNRWKANIRGVDLNRNFDNVWAKASTTAGPSWSNFKGYRAFSEPESIAMRDFVAKHDFQAYISYHSSGNVIYYWNWQTGAQEVRDKAFVRKIANITGYGIMNPMYRTGSGSSADWFIRTYKKPGITMEISPHVFNQPVPLKNWPDIWARNKSIGLFSAKESEGF